MLTISPDDPPCVPLSLWRGDTVPVPEWLFGTDAQPADLSGSAFQLDVSWWPSRLSLGSSKGSLSRTLTPDPDTGAVTWATWFADLGSVTEGQRIRYILRRVINGTVESWAQGPITLGGFVVQTDD